MYFGAFDPQAPSPPLRPDLTFAVEFQVSQILLTAEPDSLRRILKDDKLTEALLNELSFAGRVPASEMPKVRQYLEDQRAWLTKAARLILEKHGEGWLQERFLKPSSLPQGVLP